jgi:hypothetical protein
MNFIAEIRLRGAQAAVGAALAAAAAGNPPAAAGTWHADPESGVRVRIPWDDALVKNARQVEGLILHRNEVDIPPGQRYTSAVYAPGGEPFVVLWTRQDESPPTRRDLIDLAEADTGFGLTSLQVDPEALRGQGRIEAAATGALQGRVLFQIAKGSTVFLGYYWSKDEDAAYFDELVASFELTPDRRLDWEELPSGRPSLTHLLVASAGVLALGLSVTFLAALRRKPRPLPPREPPAADAEASPADGLGQRGA